MKTIARVILYLLIVYVAANALYHYGLTPLEAAAPAPMTAAYRAHAVGIYVHVFASALALLLGPLQFWARLRQRHPAWHRWLGRVYLGVGVLVGGLSGLYMSVFAHGGLATTLGFAGLALAWLLTGVMAYRSIRAGRIAQHRAWMVRNYALTLAAVSLRVYLPLSMVAGIDFEVAYAAIAWLCWIPNLLLAEAVWNRGRASRDTVAMPARARLHAGLRD